MIIPCTIVSLSEMRPAKSALYGLDGVDVFNINGSTRKSIPVRIIGGPGKDEINDRSNVKGPGKHTFIYDNESTVLNLGAESKSKIFQMILELTGTTGNHLCIIPTFQSHVFFTPQMMDLQHHLE